MLDAEQVLNFMLSHQCVADMKEGKYVFTFELCCWGVVRIVAEHTGSGEYAIQSCELLADEDGHVVEELTAKEEIK